ncbi:MAG: DUF2344 domain-containing protein [Flavonifractor plautii]
MLDTPLDQVPAKMNAALPAGITIQRCYEAVRPVKELCYVNYIVTLEYEAGAPFGAESAIRDLLARDCLVMTKRSKPAKSGFTEVDLIPLIARATVEERRDTIALDLVLRAQNPGLNPELVVAAIREHCPDAAPDSSSSTAARCWTASFRPGNKRQQTKPAGYKIPRALFASGRKPYQKYQNNDTEIVAGIGRAWTQPVGQDSGIGDAQGYQYPGEEGEQGKEPPLLFQRYPGLEIGDQRDIDAGGEPADQKLEGEEEDKVKLWNGTQKGRGQTKGGHQGAVDQKQGAQVFQGAEVGRPDQEQAGQQGSGGGGGDRQAVSGLWKLVQLHQNTGEDDLLAVGHKKIEGHHQKKEGEQFRRPRISNKARPGRFRCGWGAARRE